MLKSIIYQYKYDIFIIQLFHSQPVIKYAMLDDVYNNKIIELAANISHIGRLKIQVKLQPK